MGFWSSGIYDTSFDPLRWAVGDPISNHSYIYIFFNVYIAFISFLFILDISLIKNALERTYAYLMTFDAHWHHPKSHDIGHVFPPVFLPRFALPPLPAAEAGLFWVFSWDSNHHNQVLALPSANSCSARGYSSPRWDVFMGFGTLKIVAIPVYQSCICKLFNRLEWNDMYL